MSSNNNDNQNWDIEKLNEESSNEHPDDLKRKIIRGNEGVGEADERDLIGAVDSDDTPQGREETKNQVRSDSE